MTDADILKGITAARHSTLPKTVEMRQLIIALAERCLTPAEARIIDDCVDVASTEGLIEDHDERVARAAIIRVTSLETP